MTGLWQFIKMQLTAYENSIIEEYNGKKYGYGEILNEIESLAKKLEDKKCRGIKCAILCDKNIEATKAIFFCWKIEAIVIPLSLQYGEGQCAAIIDLVNPDYVISENPAVCNQYENAYSFNEFCVQLQKRKAEKSALNMVELIMCTSGTTGKPKASMLSAEGLITNIKKIKEYFPINSKDRILICRPLYHCAVLVGELLLSLYAGTDILFFSEGYNPMILSRILRKENISILCGTPTLLIGITEYLEARRWQVELRTIALSGEYLLKEYAERIRKSFSMAKIFNVYGLTEAGPRVSYLPSELFDSIPQSVGIPLHGIKIKIVDEQGNRKNIGKIGKVLIQTPSIMLGYYNNLEQTEKKFHGAWFDTGDLGFIDRNGYLYIVGRSDNMIIRFGMNIYPLEIEQDILKLPEVKNVMVYGVLNGEIEQINAKIVLEEKYDGLETYELMEKLSDVLPTYKLPSKIYIVQKLIYNASGKLIRPSVRRNTYD